MVLLVTAKLTPGYAGLDGFCYAASKGFLLASPLKGPRKFADRILVSGCP